MGNKIEDQFKFADLVDEGLFKTINNIALVLVLFSAEDKLILNEDEYDLALSFLSVAWLLLFILTKYMKL